MWAANTDNKSSLDVAQNQSSQPQQQTQSHNSSATAIYTTISGQTATIIPASAIQSGLSAAAGTTVHLQPHAQIVHHGGNAYLVQSTPRLEDEGPNLSHTTKASPVTVQWLCENYETADGVSLPRSTLYNHYLQHCQQEKLEPMNQASFGKLIRSVFYGLRTRRLGTRGNSKYHYYGIRIKPTSPLNHYVEDQTFAMRQYPSFHRHADYHWRAKFSNGVSYSGPNNLSGISSAGGGGLSSHSGTAGNNGSGFSGIGGSITGTGTGAGSHFGQNNDMSGANSSHQQSQHTNYLGESTSALPNLGDIVSRAELDSISDDDCLAEGVTMDDINVFCQMYLDHSDSVLSAVVYLNFKYIETLWQDFWRTSLKPQNSQWEEKLPKVQLLRLLRLEQIQKFLQLFDNVFYQSLVEVLIPNVLRPIPSALTQNIRHFAKSLESWMASATAGLPNPVIRVKMSCVCALAQTLRRHTSLNHLAQAARAVLKNTSQITQMLSDLNRVDFGNVQEQASWVCGCDGRRVDQLQQEFKRILQQQVGLEEWAEWLNRVVNDVLEPYRCSSNYPSAAHKFILRWSFYSSLVIRDLTLRSAASFGSFHLIRLLYDEYIYYLVEQKVADHLDLTPVAVTGDMGRQLMANSANAMEFMDGNNLDQQFGAIQTSTQAELDQERKERIRRVDNHSKLDGTTCLTSSIGGTTTSSPPPTTQQHNNNSLNQSDLSNKIQDTSLNNDSNHLLTSNNNNLKQPPALITTTSINITSSTSTPSSTTSSSSILTLPTRFANSVVGSSGIRKTVNVTTFGDPTPVQQQQQQQQQQHNTNPTASHQITSNNGNNNTIKLNTITPIKTEITPNTTTTTTPTTTVTTASLLPSISSYQSNVSAAKRIKLINNNTTSSATTTTTTATTTITMAAAAAATTITTTTPTITTTSTTITPTINNTNFS